VENTYIHTGYQLHKHCAGFTRRFTTTVDGAVCVMVDTVAADAAGVYRSRRPTVTCVFGVQRRLAYN